MSKLLTMESITVAPVNEKVSRLLQDLIDLELLKVIPGNQADERTALADKLWGIITPEQGEDLDRHIREIRNEWDREL